MQQRCVRHHFCDGTSVTAFPGHSVNAPNVSETVDFSGFEFFSRVFAEEPIGFLASSTKSYPIIFTVRITCQQHQHIIARIILGDRIRTGTVVSPSWGLMLEKWSLEGSFVISLIFTTNAIILGGAGT